MNVYIEDVGLRKNYKILKQCFRLLPKEQNFNLYITSKRKVFLSSLILLVLHLQKIRSIQLSQDIQKTTLPIILFANAKNSFSFRVLVTQPLNRKHIKKIEKLRGQLFVEDTSESGNDTYYSKHRNIVYRSASRDLIRERNYYGAASGMPVDNCEFSSCLGRNLYVAPDGSASFCPHNAKQTVMCNIFSIDTIFSNKKFMDILQASIAKRYSCGTCLYKPKCQGFCPLKDCADFQKNYISAQTDIDQIIFGKVDISTLPLYKEQAVLYNLLTHSAH